MVAQSNSLSRGYGTLACHTLQTQITLNIGDIIIREADVLEFYKLIDNNPPLQFTKMMVLSVEKEFNLFSLKETDSLHSFPDIVFPWPVTTHTIDSKVLVYPKALSRLWCSDY